MGPFNGEDAANFWNPKLRGPLCFNPPGARSVLPLTYKRTEMILAGKSKAQVIDALKAAYEKKELPPLEPGAMSYMMSKDQYLTDAGDHRWMAHLMFYTPLMDGVAWGADLPKSPVMLNPQFRGAPEPVRRLAVGAPGPPPRQTPVTRGGRARTSPAAQVGSVDRKRGGRRVAEHGLTPSRYRSVIRDNPHRHGHVVA